MLPDAKELGDAGTGVDGKPYEPKWIPEFKKGTIDGVLVIAGDCEASITQKLHEIIAAFHQTIHQVIRISGHSRPGEESAHEQYVS